MMALGNTVENCLAASGQQQAWIGKISLPLFCRGLPDFGQTRKDFLENLQALLGEMIAKKQVVQQKGIEYEGQSRVSK